MGDLIFDLLVVIFFVLVNAFFSGTEMAVISLNDTKMRKLAEDGDKNASRILVFLNNPGTFLATIQVGVTLAGFLSSAFAANNFAGRLALIVDPDSIRKWPVPVFTVLITIVLAYFSLVLGELVPKRIAQKNPEKWAFRAYGVVRAFGIITNPFVKFLTASTNLMLRLFKIDPNEKDKEVVHAGTSGLLTVTLERRASAAGTRSGSPDGRACLRHSRCRPAHALACGGFALEHATNERDRLLSTSQGSRCLERSQVPLT